MGTSTKRWRSKDISSWGITLPSSVVKVTQLIIIAAIIFLIIPEPLQAHTTSLSYSIIKVEGGEMAYTLVVNPHDLAVALGMEVDLEIPVPQSEFEKRKNLLIEYLQENLRVIQQGNDCSMLPVSPLYERLPEEVILPLHFQCQKEEGLIEVSFSLFFEMDASHRSIGRLVTSKGREPFVFDSSENKLRISSDSLEKSVNGWRRFKQIFIMGLEHILTGYDHLLFLITLVIISIRFWSLVKVATAFTLAHSLTLALGWFGVVEIPARTVESLIALSIAYVAIENMLGKGYSRRWLVGFGFGLVHGLGFYTVLSQLNLERSNAALTLLSFNLGVEAGQIVILALLFPVLVWGSKRVWYSQAQKWVSASILIMAAYWFFQRAFLA